MTNLTYDTLPQDILTPIVFDPQKAGDIAREIWRRISMMKSLAKFKFFRNAPERVIDALDTNWDIRARPDQLPPDMTSEDEDWLIWLLLGGRGSGKTRAGAEWVRARVEDGAKHIALVGPSVNEVREVMIEGESGLMNIGPKDTRPTYVSSRRRLEWPSGAVGHVFSAEDPDSLRGWNFDTAWADEFCAWPNPQTTLDNLRLATRKKGPLGIPKTVVTTTPKTTKALKALLGVTGLVRSNSSTLDNAGNLAPGFVSAMQDTYGGTRRGREELNGELLVDLEGSLWKRAMFDQANLPVSFAPEDYIDIILTIDPPISTGKTANACGIIVAAKVQPDPRKEAHVIVLHDGTIQGVSPTEWAERAMQLAETYQVTRIVVEANQGGDLVRTVLRNMGGNVHIKNVWAHISKHARAQSIAHHYETGRVHHANIYEALENELSRIGTTEKPGNDESKSPDRADALIWAVLDLLPVRKEVNQKMSML